MGTFSPVRSVRFFTPGVLLVLAVALLGWGAGIYRMLTGLAATTNLNDQFPWGIWIAIDVATGVALAAGGFTTAALTHIFHRGRYHGLTRAALLTALLGYTFVAIGLLFDLGRWYNVWHPLIYWQGNSVLFEVGVCVIAYLTVLYLEFLPVLAERFHAGLRFPAPLRILEGPARTLVLAGGRAASRIMSLLILAGVVLSCMHQSSLGALMLIAPTKVHPLWYSPVLPLLFLTSAVAVGFPMVILESVLAHRSFRRPQDLDVLAPLSRLVPLTLGIYLAIKIGDLLIRDAWVHLLPMDGPALAWVAEVGLGGALPLLLFLLPWTRRAAWRLLLAASLVVGGVAMNRIDVFLVSWRPPYASGPYVPTLIEVALTAGLVATLVLLYRFAALRLPVLESREGDAT
ncbi:MAG: Ni/Fe-hydrogenase cytochrome b subunit [Deltaproteobacteria bacterium]|nr:Ni/Fe-hydrogenase cytochrome b subunit [Deltaproteobacteria bacterium]